MKTRTIVFLIASLVALPALAQRYTDEEIRRILMEDSVRFSGECPCPYSYAWNGRQCADKSQYVQAASRPDRPLCYPSDVTHNMIREYRERYLR
jgi:hypothetical protein